MQGFRSAGGLQRFISIFSALRNLFVTPHHRRSALATHIHPGNGALESRDQRRCLISGPIPFSILDETT
jgi:hypothetical protein